MNIVNKHIGTLDCPPINPASLELIITSITPPKNKLDKLLRMIGLGSPKTVITTRLACDTNAELTEISSTVRNVLSFGYLNPMLILIDIYPPFNVCVSGPATLKGKVIHLVKPTNGGLTDSVLLIGTV